MVRRGIEPLTLGGYPGAEGFQGWVPMIQFFLFMYAMLAVFVIQAIRRNQKLQRPSHQMVTAVGWGLFSLSSTLAVLMMGVAFAVAMGFNLTRAGLAIPAL
jgi:hypothetical protein